jgi:hypothetical protein
MKFSLGASRLTLFPRAITIAPLITADQNDVIPPSTLRNGTGLTDERQQAQQLLGHVI